MKVMENISNEELIQEVRDRNMWIEILDMVPESELIREIENRGLESEWEEDIEDLSDHDIADEAKKRCLNIIAGSNDDLNQVFIKYYDKFKWEEVNALLKHAYAIKKSGQPLAVDFSMLDAEVIS